MYDPLERYVFYDVVVEKSFFLMTEMCRQHEIRNPTNFNLAYECEVIKRNRKGFYISSYSIYI